MAKFTAQEISSIFAGKKFDCIEVLNNLKNAEGIITHNEKTKITDFLKYLLLYGNLASNNNNEHAESEISSTINKLFTNTIQDMSTLSNKKILLDVFTDIITNKEWLLESIEKFTDKSSEEIIANNDLTISIILAALEDFENIKEYNNSDKISSELINIFNQSPNILLKLIEKLDLNIETIITGFKETINNKTINDEQKNSLINAYINKIDINDLLIFLTVLHADLSISNDIIENLLISKFNDENAIKNVLSTQQGILLLLDIMNRSNNQIFKNQIETILHENVINVMANLDDDVFKTQASKLSELIELYLLKNLMNYSVNESPELLTNIFQDNLLLKTISSKIEDQDRIQYYKDLCSHIDYILKSTIPEQEININVSSTIQNINETIKANQSDSDVIQILINSIAMLLINSVDVNDKNQLKNEFKNNENLLNELYKYRPDKFAEFIKNYIQNDLDDEKSINSFYKTIKLPGQLFIEYVEKSDVNNLEALTDVINIYDKSNTLFTSNEFKTIFNKYYNLTKDVIVQTKQQEIKLLPYHQEMRKIIINLLESDNEVTLSDEMIEYILKNTFIIDRSVHNEILKRFNDKKITQKNYILFLQKLIDYNIEDKSLDYEKNTIINSCFKDNANAILLLKNLLSTNSSSAIYIATNFEEYYASFASKERVFCEILGEFYKRNNDNQNIKFNINSMFDKLDKNIETRLSDKINLINNLYTQEIIKLEDNIILEKNQNPLNYFFAFKGYSTAPNEYAGLKNLLHAFKYKDQEPWKTYWNLSSNIENVEYFKKILNDPSPISFYSNYIEYLAEIPQIIKFMIYSKNFISTINIQNHVGKNDPVSKEIVKLLYLDNDHRDNLTHPKKLLKNLLSFNNVKNTQINENIKKEIDSYINNKLKSYAESQLVEILCNRLKKEIGFDDKSDSVYTYIKSFLPSKKNSEKTRVKNLEIKEDILNILNKNPQTLKELNDLVKDNEKIKNIISNAESWHYDLEIANFLDAMFSINENNVVDFFEKRELDRKSNINSNAKRKPIFFNKQFINNPPFNRGEHIKKCFGSNISVINNEIADKLGLKSLDNATKSLILKDITLGTSTENLNLIFDDLTNDLNFYYKNPQNELITNDIININKDTNNLKTNLNTEKYENSYDTYNEELNANELKLKNAILDEYSNQQNIKIDTDFVSNLNELSLKELIAIITDKKSSAISQSQNNENKHIIKLISERLFENIDNLMSLNATQLTSILPLIAKEVETISLNQLLKSVYPQDDVNDESVKIYIDNICKCSFVCAALSVLDTPYAAKFKSLHRISEENLKQMRKEALVNMISDSKDAISESLFNNITKKTNNFSENKEDSQEAAWISALSYINFLEFSSKYKDEQEFKVVFSDREQISNLLTFYANNYDDPTKHIILMNILESNIEDFIQFIDRNYLLKYSLESAVLINNLYSLYKNELSLDKIIKLFNNLSKDTNASNNTEFAELRIVMAIDIIVSPDFNIDQNISIINTIVNNITEPYIVEFLSQPEYLAESKKIFNIIFDSIENYDKNQIIKTLFSNNNFYDLLKQTCKENEKTKRTIIEYIENNFGMLISNKIISKTNLIDFLKDNNTPKINIPFKQVIGYNIHKEYGSKSEILALLQENNLINNEVTTLNPNDNPIILAARTDDLQALKFLYEKREEKPWIEYWQLAGDAENTLINCLNRNENNRQIKDIFNKLVEYIYTIPSIIEHVIFEDILEKNNKTTKIFAEMFLSKNNYFYSTHNIISYLQKFKIEKLKNKNNAAMNAPTSMAHRSDTYAFILNKIYAINNYLQKLKDNYYPQANKASLKKQIVQDNRLIILKCFLENEPPIDKSGDHEIWEQLVDLCGAEAYINKVKSKGPVKFNDFKVFALQNNNILDAINTPRFPGIKAAPPSIKDSVISNLLIKHIHKCDANGRNKNQSFFTAWDVDITDTWSSPDEYATGIGGRELQDLKDVFECTGLLMRQEPEDILEKLQSFNDINALIEKMEFSKAIDLKNRIIEAQKSKKPFNKTPFEEDIKTCIIEQQKILQMGFVEALTQIRSDNSCITGRITRLGMFVLRYTPYFSNHDYTDVIKVYFEDKFREFSDSEITKILVNQLNDIISVDTNLSPSIKLAIKNIIKQKPTSLDYLNKSFEACEQSIAQDIKLLLFPREGKKFNIQQNEAIANFLDAMFTINDATLPTLIAEGQLVTATTVGNSKNQKFISINDFDKPPYNRETLLRKCYGSSKQILQNAYKNIGFPKQQINQYSDSFCLKSATSGPGSESMNDIFKDLNKKIDSLAMSSNNEEVVFKIASLANDLDYLMVPKNLSNIKPNIETEYNELNSSTASSPQKSIANNQLVTSKPSTYLKGIFSFSFKRAPNNKDIPKLSEPNKIIENETIKRNPAQAMLLTFTKTGDIATTIVDQINTENKMTLNNPYSLDLRTDLKRILDIILSTKRDSIKQIDPYKNKTADLIENIFTIAKEIINTITKEELENIQKIQNIPPNIKNLLKNPKLHLQRFEKIKSKYSDYVNFKASIRNMYTNFDEKQPNDEYSFESFLNILKIKKDDKVLTKSICNIAEQNKEYINSEFLRSIRFNLTSPNITFENMMEIISTNTPDIYQPFLQKMNECIKQRDAINEFTEIFSTENTFVESIVDKFFNIVNVCNNTLKIDSTLLEERIKDIFDNNKLRDLFIKKLNSLENKEDFNKLLKELLLSQLNLLIKDLHDKSFARAHINDGDTDPIENNIKALRSICTSILEISMNKTVSDQVIEQLDKAWFEILTNEDFKASNTPINLELSNISNTDTLIDNLYKHYLPVDVSASAASTSRQSENTDDKNTSSSSRKRKT